MIKEKLDSVLFKFEGISDEPAVKTKNKQKEHSVDLNGAKEFLKKKYQVADEDLD